MQTEEISISHDAYQILKFHGSYMQDDRSLRKKGQEKVRIMACARARGEFFAGRGFWGLGPTGGRGGFCGGVGGVYCLSVCWSIACKLRVFA